MSKPRPTRRDEIDRDTAALVSSITAILSEPCPDGADPIQDARSRATRVFAGFAGPSGGCVGVPTRIDGAAGPLDARLYAPSQDRRVPLTVFFHGGGWAVGTLGDYEPLLGALAAEAGMPILSVAYRLAPEHPFPAALEDALVAIRTACSADPGFGARPGSVFVMGDSAGGNIAAAATRLLTKDDCADVLAQFLLYPMLDVSRSHEAYASRMAFGGGEHFLTRDAIDNAVLGYLGGGASAQDPRVSPLLGEDLSGLPPTYISVGRCDPLRDEAIAYANRLRGAGVAVDIDVVPGAIHAFLSFGVLDQAHYGRTLLANQMRRRLIELS